MTEALLQHQCKHAGPYGYHLAPVSTHSHPVRQMEASTAQRGLQSSKGPTKVKVGVESRTLEEAKHHRTFPKNNPNSTLETSFFCREAGGA